MDTEISGEQAPERTDQSAFPAETRAPAASEGHKPCYECTRRAKTPEAARKITWLEYVLAGTNIGLVIVGIFAAIIYNGQLGVMQGTLNRARSLEDAMLSLGHSEAAGEIDTEHPQVHAALTAARVFRDDNKSFANLTLYEQRLHRTLDKTLRELKALQSERKAQRQAELDAAVAERNLLKMKVKHGHHHLQTETEPITRQFVFSTAEIESEARRQFRLTDIATAQRHHYDFENYRRYAPKWAA